MISGLHSVGNAGFAQSMQCRAGLLFGCFDADIAHGGAGSRFTDDVCIKDVALVAGDKRANILWRDQLHLMAETSEQAGC